MITRSLNDINVIQQAILQTIQLVLPVPFWLWRASSSLVYRSAMGTLLGVVVAIVLVAAVFTVCQRGADFYAPTGLYRPHERGAAREYCGRARHPCV